jgi:hypothetical protein
MNNCYAAINVKSMKSMNAFTGGLIGGNFSTISNSSASGIVDAWNGANIYAGGLVGYSNGTVKYSHATGNVNAGNATTRIYAGGLSGVSNTIEYSYATGDVEITGNILIVLVGGLTGQSYELSQYNWAGGDVTVTPEKIIPGYSGSRIYAGGFLGTSNSSMQNCYALGNVKIDINASLILCAGGIAGYVEALSGTPELKNLFSKGNVEIKSNTSSSTNTPVRAGGIVGEFDGGKLERVVGLGETVTAIGSYGYGSDRSAFRIGYSGSKPTTFNNNHAFIDMEIGIGINGYNLGVFARPASSSVAVDQPNGAHVTDATTRTANFWSNTVGFATASFWDTTGIGAARNYPLLRGLASWTDAEKASWMAAQEEAAR